MVVGRQHLEDRARDFHAPLDRLVGVGVGPHGDGPRGVAGLRKFAFQQVRGVGLGEEFGLEIEARR